MDHRQVIRTIAAGRVVIGTALLLAPGLGGRWWIGPTAGDRGVKVVIRALAVRDLAIGVGTLQALAEGQPVRGWARAGGAGDLVDAAGSLLATRRIGAGRALAVTAVGAVAGLASLVAAEHID